MRPPFRTQFKSRRWCATVSDGSPIFLWRANTELRKLMLWKIRRGNHTFCHELRRSDCPCLNAALKIGASCQLCLKGLPPQSLPLKGLATHCEYHCLGKSSETALATEARVLSLLWHQSSRIWTGRQNYKESRMLSLCRTPTKSWRHHERLHPYRREVQPAYQQYSLPCKATQSNGSHTATNSNGMHPGFSLTFLSLILLIRQSVYFCIFSYLHILYMSVQFYV